ncbi:hypothetical protein, partial [Aeromonas caviae]|uniref:hypothetical protein n=1 Tax=Aeromonas caviae TaxID=648 RepID=UPI001CC37DAC
HRRPSIPDSLHLGIQPLYQCQIYRHSNVIVLLLCTVGQKPDQPKQGQNDKQPTVQSSRTITLL